MAGGERVESAAMTSAAAAEAEAASKVAAAKALGEENRIIARAQTIRVHPLRPARVLCPLLVPYTREGVSSHLGIRS